MTETKPGQLYFLLGGLLPLTKLILYPSFLASVAENDLLFSALANFLLQGIVIFFLLLLMQKTDKTFFTLLSDTFGSVVAKIIFFFYALFFLFSAIIPIFEQKLLIRSAFYDTTPSLIAFLPFFFFSGYLCTKRLRVIGRSAALLAPVCLICLFGILLLAFDSAKFDSLLPAFQNGTGVWQGSLHSFPWFADSAFLLFFLGRVKPTKGLAWKGICFYLFGMLLTLLFLACFYGVFSSIAIQQNSAISEIGKYYSALGTLGRIDYLLTYTLSVGLFFYLALPLLLSVQCLCAVFTDKPVLFSVLLNAGLAVFVVVFNHEFVSIQALFASLWWVFLLFAYLLPLLAWTLRRKT